MAHKTPPPTVLDDLRHWNEYQRKTVLACILQAHREAISRALTNDGHIAIGNTLWNLPALITEDTRGVESSYAKMEQRPADDEDRGRIKWFVADHSDIIEPRKLTLYYLAADAAWTEGQEQLEDTLPILRKQLDEILDPPHRKAFEADLRRRLYPPVIPH